MDYVDGPYALVCIQQFVAVVVEVQGDRFGGEGFVSERFIWRVRFGGLISEEFVKGLFGWESFRRG